MTCADTAEASVNETERRAAVQAAFDRLPALLRVVFLLYRKNGHSFTDIAGRLSISTDAVEGSIIEALTLMCRMLDGEPPQRRENAHVIAAEAYLRQRYRRYRMLRVVWFMVRAPRTFEQWIWDQVVGTVKAD